MGKLWDLLNTLVGDLVKRNGEYEICKTTTPKGYIEIVKVYSDGRKVSYEPPVYLIPRIPREFLLPREVWLKFPDDL